MDIDMVMNSASCDLKICNGHMRNQDIAGARKCFEAAVKRIDAVIAFCDKFNVEYPYKLDNMIKFSTDLYDDLIDSETMFNYFNNIKDLPNARTEELI
jgi:hypothetical protein